MYYIGVDLGTSAVKLLLMAGAGKILNVVSREYPLRFPQPGWSEQDPQDWIWESFAGIRELTADIDRTQVAGIGCGGQMHGLVALDAEDRVIRPAILWNDGRTEEETAWLNTAVGKERLSALTANIAFAGFTAPKILWMRKNEPENFARIAKIMLPKDYINYKLTGVHSCDYSDASGMLLLDVEHKRWSGEMLEICGLKEEQMPRLFESCEPVGTIRGFVSGALGLPRGCLVVAGAGDNAAAAVGTGVVGEGGCNLSLGTSGTLFISSKTFCAAPRNALHAFAHADGGWHLMACMLSAASCNKWLCEDILGTSGTLFISSKAFGVDPNNALHAFAHADGGFHLMGCMLSAASCNKWFCDEILKTGDYAAEQRDIADERLGRNRVFFLPYLMGERSPINDVDARGTLIGMTMDTSRADLVQAVLEGVAFAIRDSFEVAKSLGVPVDRSKLCGGGAKSPLWRTILANVLGVPLELPTAEEGPGFGGAMLAMVGCGVYGSVQAAADALVELASTTEPEPALTARYEAQYQKYRRIYPALKAVFPEIQ